MGTSAESRGVEYTPENSRSRASECHSGRVAQGYSDSRIASRPGQQKGSGYLGTEADWDTWLFISDLQTRVGISLLKAEYQAAWKRFDFESYSDWPEAERLSNSAEHAAESVHERNAHHITRSRQTVDNAIKTIYPRQNS